MSANNAYTGWIAPVPISGVVATTEAMCASIMSLLTSARWLYAKGGAVLALESGFAFNDFESQELTPRDRNEQSAPLVPGLELWLKDQRSRLSHSASVAQPIDYLLKRWPSFI